MAASPAAAAPGVIVRLARRLNASYARVSDVEKRASVALILRITHTHTDTHTDRHKHTDNATHMGSGGAQADAELRSRSPRDTEAGYRFDAATGSFLDSAAAVASTLDTSEILYIKRAFSATDPWSGNVAFPGGRREPHESDYDAAVRETMEEIGLDLSKQPKPFMYLGRLDDRPVFARGRRQGMALCPFVFLQTVPQTPPLCLNTSEVAAVRWIPLSHLSETHVDPFGITMPFRFVPGLASVPEPLKRWIGIDKVHHPSILLQAREAGLATGPGSIATQVMAEYAVSDEARGVRTTTSADASTEGENMRPPLVSTPAVNNQPRVAASAPDNPPSPSNDPNRFQLWGLTMQATSDLLAAAGLKRLAWPPIRLNGFLVNTWVYAICGGLETIEVLTGARQISDINPKHLAWLTALLCTPVVAYAGMQAFGMWPRL